MTLRMAQVVRVVTFVVAAVVVLLIVSRLLSSPADDEHIDPASGTLTVNDAIQKISATPVAVRGYVFEGPGGLALRLCDARKKGHPPSCIGPFLDLYGPAAGSLDLRSGHDSAGRAIRWSPDPVTLVGPVTGARLDVQQVLR